MRRLALYSALALLTIAGLVLLWQFRSVVALFGLAVVLAAAVRPVVDRLVDRGLPRWLAAVLTYLFGLAVVASVLVIVMNPLVAELQSLADASAAAYEQVLPRWAERTPFLKAVVEQLPPADLVYEMILGAEGERIVANVLGITRGLFGLASGLAIILALSIYWTADQVRVERLILSLLPAVHRTGARNMWQATITHAGAYMRSEAVQSLLALGLLSAGYAAFGLNFPLTIALFGAIARLIPLIGVLLAPLPVLLMGWSQGWPVTLAAAAFSVAVLVALRMVVGPRLRDRQPESPILTLLVMLALVDEFGLLGLIVAPPLAAAIHIVLTFAFDRQRVTPASEPAEQMTALRRRLQALQAGSAMDEQPLSPEAVSLAERLENLLGQAAGAVQAASADRARGPG
jgi:predicted PurR-regulated permease PerM